MKPYQIIILIICAIILVVSGIIIATALTTPSETLEINDINITQDEFGIYNLQGHITPLKDFDYLQASITLYDDKGVVIGESSCSWNSVHVKKGTTQTLSNSLGCTCDGNPAYAVVTFYDTPGMDHELCNTTIKLNGTNTKSSNSTSSSAAPNLTSQNPVKNNDKTPERDSVNYPDDDYSMDYSTDDDYSSSSGGSSGSSDGGSESADDSVETTVND